MSNTTSFVENFNLYKKAYKTARTERAEGINPLEKYVTSQNVTALNSRLKNKFTFGIEIEFNSGNVSSILADLREHNLLTQTRMYEYHRNYNRPDSYSRWQLQHDGSVSGGEMITPILKDDTKSWEELSFVTKSLNEHGAEANSRNVGGHINMGTSVLGDNLEAWKTFYTILIAYEDIMYRLAANPVRGYENGLNSEGRQRASLHRRGGYCTPLSSVSLDRVRQAGSLADMIDLFAIRTYDVSMYSANFISDLSRVEWRIFDGTTDESLLQTRIKIVSSIANASLNPKVQEIAKTFTAHPVGFHRSNGPRQELPDSTGLALRGEAWRTDTLLFREFLDLIFTRKKDKEQVSALFAINSWNFGRRR